MDMNTTKGSRNFYGEYSLEQWINFMLAKEIVLPDYQRAFVWEKEDVEDLINSLKSGSFVPPITIGNYGGKTNYILDGQQRLSAILIAYLGLFPKRKMFKFRDKAYASTANENDDLLDEDENRMPIEWKFNCFTQAGQNRNSILENIDRSKYDSVDYKLSKSFWKNSYIGFSLIIPISDKETEQQKLYSSVFRNINIKGKPLSPLDSRKSLYFLRDNFDQWFAPQFANSITINNAPIDFVRYLSLLSQYKTNKETSKLAQNYKTRMEQYYESYILAEVNNENNTMFTPLLSANNKPRYQQLEAYLTADCFPKEFTSIIDADVYLFGAIYNTLAEGKTIRPTEDLLTKIKEEIRHFKNDSKHSKSPSALNALRSRIQTSINIYHNYPSDLTTSDDEA